MLNTDLSSILKLVLYIEKRPTNPEGTPLAAMLAKHVPSDCTIICFREIDNNCIYTLFAKFSPHLVRH